MQASHPSYYDILQVAPDAPPGDIRAAYRRMAQRYHPDKSPDNRYAPRVMANVNKAYEVLSDPAQREGHDRWIQRQETPRPVASARMSRPAPLPELHTQSKRWPWYLLFATITCAVLAFGLVVFKTELASRPGAARIIGR